MKEIQFLNGVNSHLSWSDYLELFQEREPGAVYGEISPSYLGVAPHRIQELRDHVPHVRLFAILRNPVDRDWSNVRMVAEGEGKLHEADALAAIARRPSLQAEGDYVTALRNWLRVFPREQILLLPYELLARDQDGFLGSIARHLGVQATPLHGLVLRRFFEGPDILLPPDIRSLLVARHAGVVRVLSELCEVEFSAYWPAELV